MREKMTDNTDVNWVFDNDGDITLVSEKSSFSKVAWFRYEFLPDNKIAFGLIGKKQIKMQKDVYAVYHSKLMEFFLTYFDNCVTTKKNKDDYDEVVSIEVTINKTKPDNFE